MKIPFVDLYAQYVSIKSEIDRAIFGVIENAAFIRGERVFGFENEYAREYGVEHCVSCANGTDALYIALKMLGIGSGDEVITTAHSWISTSEVITQTGARPVFVDVDQFYHIDVNGLEHAITPHTKAIIPVHLFGQPADMPNIMSLARKLGLKVIEDCAQAHFATINNQYVGTFGDVGTFSFYPGKNLGAYGDAGCIITNDGELADKMRAYANHGALKKHRHQMEGINSRLDGIQAAVLSAKLPYVHDWTAARQNIANWYDELLEGIASVSVPKRRPGAGHVFHLYVVQIEDRDAMRAHLSSKGIETGIHYPTALPFLAAYQYMRHTPADFPRAYHNQSRILSLPIYPEMTRLQVAAVVDGIRESLAS